MLTRLENRDLGRLLRAAKTSIALFEMFYETMWRLYPDELVSITEENQDLLADLLTDYIQTNSTD